MSHGSRQLAVTTAGLLAAGTTRPGAPPASASDEVSLDIKRTASSFQVDAAREQLTLPLFRGLKGSKLLWYIVTDGSDKDDAQRRGVIWSPKLAASSARATSSAAV